MILEALNEYYERKSADSDRAMPRNGMERKELKFLIEIDLQGNFVQLLDLREGKRGREYEVPRAVGRTSAKKADLLWGNLKYVLGYESSLDEKQQANAKECNEIFIAKIKELPSDLVDNPYIAAILAFYIKGEDAKVLASPNWEVCSKIAGCTVSFIDRDSQAVAPTLEVISAFAEQKKDDALPQGICLVSGERSSIARTHKKITMGTQQTSLVSFQVDSGYDSYGKDQGFNAPVSAEVEFAYTSALNHLLRSDKNRVQLGGLTCLFWASKATELEDAFAASFGEPPRDNPDKEVEKVKLLLESLKIGAKQPELEQNFYVLGVEPNKSRLQIKLWEQGTLGYFVEQLDRHYNDCSLVHSYGRNYLLLPELLRATALRSDSKKVISSLYESVFQSILTGRVYPMLLFQQVLVRIQSEQNPSYPRVAILKACINRWARKSMFDVKEVKYMLDRENTDTAYVLGRVFAILENIQKANASHQLNATIKDRFYSAASTTPVFVFPRLIDLSNHHLADMRKNAGKKGLATYLEKELTEAMGCLSPSSIPANFNSFSKANFAIGYYHQKQDFFAGKRKETQNEEEN